jgi:hypothetical protein
MINDGYLWHTCNLPRAGPVEYLQGLLLAYTM